MIQQSIKDVYYGLLVYYSWLAKIFYRAHYRIFNKCRQLHLGCGPNYLKGYVNLDGNFGRKVDYLLDLRVGLPFPSASMDFIYSCHMLEHLYVTDAIKLLKECRRVLSPNGYLRLTLPSFDQIHRILSGGQDSLFPRRFQCRTGQAVNFLFCDGQHKYAYNAEILGELCHEAGFSRIEPADLNADPHFPPKTLDEPEESFCVHLYK